MSRFLDAFRQGLIQMLAVSERTIRSVFTVTVGATTLLTETLFPESLRGTTTYKVTLGMLQQYIIEHVAEMKEEANQSGIEISDDYAQRKMVGTALEAAGLLTIGFSPMWVFAIVGDAAGGSKVYMNRLVDQLKKDGVIAEETEITELADLFAAVQSATSQSATAVDMPPLSREELSDLADEMKTGYAKAFSKTTNLLPQLDTIWENMGQLANRENISIERLSGIMTMTAMEWRDKGAGIAVAASRTGAELIDEKILDSYRKTLAETSEQGLENYMRSHMRPFLQTARSHFDASRTTWVERKFGNSMDNDSGN
jgi:DNA-binding transcriptional regulator YbjK